MLDGSIPRKKALIHFILITKVEDMKVIFYKQSRHCFFKTLNHGFELNFNNSLSKKSIYSLSYLL